MSALTLAQAFQEGLREEMARDERIFLLGTDLYIRGGHWAQAKGIGPEFGEERVRDTPISEAAMVAAGVGAALYGMRPIVDLNFVDFIFGAIDETVNQAAKIRYLWDVGVPLVVRATSGVAFGSAQHNNSVEAWFAHTPGLLIATPATPADTKALLKAALRGQDPIIFLMHGCGLRQRRCRTEPDRQRSAGTSTRRACQRRLFFDSGCAADCRPDFHCRRRQPSWWKFCCPELRSVEAEIWR